MCAENEARECRNAGMEGLAGKITTSNLLPRQPAGDVAVRRVNVHDRHHKQPGTAGDAQKPESPSLLSFFTLPFQFSSALCVIHCRNVKLLVQGNVPTKQR